MLAFVVAFFFCVSVLAGGVGAALGIQGGFQSGKPTTTAVEDIPADFLPIFLKAAHEYGVSWAVLAAIAKIESGFGQGKEYLARGGVSPKGAVGFMQFMPTTWSGSGNPLARDDPDSPSWDTDPERIARYGGYGVDADGDGKADPYNPWDAIFAAAKYLAANGFAQNPSDALYHYNHSWTYVSRVLEKAEQYSGSMIPLAEGVWPLPVGYTKVTSGFGLREFEGEVEFHYGMDVACPVGTPVFAVLPGRVVHDMWKGWGGLTVVLEHEGNVETVYCHLSEILVKYGEKVEKGQPIGLSGNTGRSSGPHLHFAVKVNGRFCDPEKWLGVPSQNY